MTEASDMLYNSQVGVVYPPQAAPLLPDRDARDYAMEALKRYLCALVFRRTNADGLEPIPFQLPLDSVQVQQPDDPKDLPLPGIGIIPGRGIHEQFGLGPPTTLDGSDDVAGPGTALLHLSDYIEPFIIEVWGSKKAERRALVAGIQAAMRQSDGSQAIYLNLPEYYGMTASFYLDATQYIDGDEVSRNRRRAQLSVLLTVCEVAVTNVRPLNASIEMTVLDGNLVATLDC